MAKLIALPERGVLKVSGEESEEFLQNLITNNMKLLESQDAMFAGLLSPQGKINFEFFILSVGNDYYLDMLASELSGFLKKLALYKLRADVQFADLSETHKVFAFDNASKETEIEGVLSFRDPRSKKMGQRMIVPVEAAEELSNQFDVGEREYYTQLRLKNSIPEGGVDYQLGDTFPHEAAYDQLQAIDFKKGCYIGQEVVSRMQHRGSVRKRIVKIIGEGELPTGPQEIRAGQSLIGMLGSRLGGEGLGLVRLDRAETAEQKGEKMQVDGRLIKIEMPEWADYQLSSE